MKNVEGGDIEGVAGGIEARGAEKVGPVQHAGGDASGAHGRNAGVQLGGEREGEGVGSKNVAKPKKHPHIGLAKEARRAGEDGAEARGVLAKARAPVWVGGEGQDGSHGVECRDALGGALGGLSAQV